jgi:hypothetical protein
MADQLLIEMKTILDDFAQRSPEPKSARPDSTPAFVSHDHSGR